MNVQEDRAASENKSGRLANVGIVIEHSEKKRMMRRMSEAYNDGRGTEDNDKRRTISRAGLNERRHGDTTTQKRDPKSTRDGCRRQMGSKRY